MKSMLSIVAWPSQHVTLLRKTKSAKVGSMDHQNKMKMNGPPSQDRPTRHGVNLMFRCREVESTHKERIHSNTNILGCRSRIVDHRDRLSKRCIRTRVRK
jgi:hypothetical protein